MKVSDRMFRIPAADLDKINARLTLLPPRVSAMIEHAGNALAAGDLRIAQQLLASVLAAAPGQADGLRLYGLLLSMCGNLPAAYANLEAALGAAPADAMGYWQYARVCEQAGDMDAAWRLRTQAVQRIPDSPLAVYDLGEHLARHQQPEQALEPLERATRLAPEYAPAHLKLGDALVACGHVVDGAAAMRRALALEPAFAAAWINLADIKTVPVTDIELERMRALLHGKALSEAEHTAVEFAVGKVCEDRGRYQEAFDCLVDANARRKRELRAWDALRFVDQERRAEQLFGAPHASAKDVRLGNQVVFIVGMPRSGTTLVEQILAAHPEVRGAGELGEVAQVLTEESTRLQRHYPDWVPQTDASAWERMGKRYLELTVRHQAGGQRFTDKMPNNWRALGAIRAMLPGARIVVCRRDPLENCWSCFKQFFTDGWEFTYDMQHLALVWKTFDRVAAWWARHDPEHVRVQGYEALTEDPQSQTRALLEFCGLPFDAACLDFFRARRSVHTLSAAQVRQPMHRHLATAAAYGALLDPLRVELGLPPLA